MPMPELEPHVIVLTRLQSGRNHFLAFIEN